MRLRLIIYVLVSEVKQVYQFKDAVWINFGTKNQMGHVKRRKEGLSNSEMKLEQ